MLTTTKPKPGMQYIEIDFYLTLADDDRRIAWRSISKYGQKRLLKELARRGLPPPGPHITGSI